jgi:hypothetical protein
VRDSSRRRKKKKNCCCVLIAKRQEEEITHSVVVAGGAPPVCTVCVGSYPPSLWVVRVRFGSVLSLYAVRERRG